MKHRKNRVLARACTLAAIITALPAGAAITFESVPLGSPHGPPGAWNGESGSGGFTVGGVHFNNTYTDFGGGFNGWTGFAVSNQYDATTPGYGNQYSAYAPGSGNFAIGYTSAVITMPLANLAGTGASITTTTYSALSMIQGDSFAKKYGGASGSDPDFLLLTIRGFAGGIPTGASVDFYLADYRFADNSLDYIVDEWTWVDFSPLGTVDEIRFEYSSSDTGDFGINTPTYFAMDNLTAIPEPSSAWLALAAGGFVLRRKRPN